MPVFERYAEGSVYQLIQTNALVNPGDSGGCLFAGSVGLERQSRRWKMSR